MEKPKALSRSVSPLKNTRKGDQRVQFVETKELGVKGQKVYGKPPEGPKSQSRNGGWLYSSSSTGNINNSNSSNRSCSSSISSADKSGSRDSLNWSSSLDRRRPGSLKKVKHVERSQILSQNRSQSLDRRRSEKLSQRASSSAAGGSDKKHQDIEGKDGQNREKKKVLPHNGTQSRSYSVERSKHPSRLKQPGSLQQDELKGETQTESKSSQSDAKSTSYLKSGEGNKKAKRNTSRSPRRHPNKDTTGNEDKENTKSKEKHRSNDSHTLDSRERGRSLRREQWLMKTAAEKNANTKLKDTWVFEEDVMWTISPSGRRTGYLLFSCSNLEKPRKHSVVSKYGMAYKFSQADSKLIRMLMESHGLTETDSNSTCFNLYWGNGHFNPNEIRQLQEWQRVNHFPRSSELTRKDRLYMNIRRMQRQFGFKLFDYIPTSFVLPTEHREFCETHLREKGTWIVKPVASSQGKGIYLVTQVDQVPADETALVCRYIESPLLVDGYKCDLRLYVLVTSLDPLVVYMYEEGLVRLATVRYQHGKNLWNPCIHLTNYSVNKFHSDYVQNEDPEVDDQGNKWSLSAFLRHLKSQGIDTGMLMRSIEDVIIKSLLAVSYQMNTAANMFVPHMRNCFELYGFDVLIDSHLKPWVLEVNLSPSLNIDQPLDLKIKSAMLSDLFSLVGIPVCNPHTARVSSRPSVYRKLPSVRYSTDSYDRNMFGRGTNTVAIVPNAEEMRIIRQVREENERRGGWARIFPTPDSWTLYSGLQEYESPFNLILHCHLYPHVPRNSRFTRVTPMRMSSVSSSGLASSLERLTCYERALPKGLAYLKSKLHLGRSSSEKSVTKDLKQVKAALVAALENGLALSKYQARMAFSVYLQHIQRRLMIGCDEEKQTDLVYRFLRSAVRTLHIPISVQAPSKTLPNEARAVVISKQLGDFIQAYTKETHLYFDQSSSVSCSSLSSQCPTSFVSTPSDPTVDGMSSSTVPTISGDDNQAVDSTANSGRNSCPHVTNHKRASAGDLQISDASPSDALAKSKSRGVLETFELSASSASVCSSDGASNNASLSGTSVLYVTAAVSSAGVASYFLKSNASDSLPPTSSHKTSVSTCVQVPFSTSCSEYSASKKTLAHSAVNSLTFTAAPINSVSCSSMQDSTMWISSSAPSTSKSSSLVSVSASSASGDGSVCSGDYLSFTSKIQKLRGDGDSGIFSTDDDGNQLSTTLDVSDGDQEGQADGSKLEQQQKSRDDGIQMELYRAFIANARESDLEEVLSLQTRMHNSAGVFLDPARRPRSHHHYYTSSNTISVPVTVSGTSPTSTSTVSRPRTPTASPHGSPRRSRRSPSHGSQTSLNEAVTSEPHSSRTASGSQVGGFAQDVPTARQSGGAKDSGHTSSPTVSASLTSTPSTSKPNSASSSSTSTCCLFGNILKATLKGTRTSFIT